MNNKVLSVMELAVEFVDNLSDKELEEILSGESKFNIARVEKRIVKSKKVNTIKPNKEDTKSTQNPSDIIKQLESREEAAQYIKSLKLTNDKLIKLGSELGLKISKREKKSRIIEIIVEDIVGTKLKREGLKSGIMGNKNSK